MKNIGAELAEQIVARFASPEVRALISQTNAASDEDTGTFRVVGTTENLDRYQEVIKLDGWDTERYMANPVILWGHDHSRLIGMTTSIEIVDGKMVFSGKFAPTEEGQEKRRLYDLGFLRATSVGFIEKEREGNLITKAELLELSFVSVPANPYALSLAFERGLNEQELITKGIMFVEKEQTTSLSHEPENEPVTTEESSDGPEGEGEVESPSGEPLEAQERSFSTKDLQPVVVSLRSALVALEALGNTAEEPEGDEPAEAGEETEDERRFREFTEARQFLQEFATLTSDVLADARKAAEAKRAA